MRSKTLHRLLQGSKTKPPRHLAGIFKSSVALKQESSRIERTGTDVQSISVREEGPVLARVLTKIAKGDGNLNQVRFGALCGLKSDISQGLGSTPEADATARPGQVEVTRANYGCRLRHFSQYALHSFRKPMAFAPFPIGTRRLRSG